eukprot:Opistho-1_new@86698
MLQHFTVVSKVDRRQFYFFPAYIVPDIQFCPVADGEYPHIFSFVNTAVVCIPEFGTLQFGIPLSEFIPYRKDPFFGTGLLFIAPGTTYAGVKFEFIDRIQQGKSLQGISAGKFTPCT